MLFDHIALKVGDFAKSRAFFVEVLLPLKIHVVKEGDGWAGFGREGRMQFVIAGSDDPQKPMHIAFAAMTHEEVRQFHKAALSAGGRDNGAPGIRASHSPTYFAAFVIAPDGHNIEAVTRIPSD